MIAFFHYEQFKLFESKQIRTTWNELEQKWYFVVADVVQVLTGTANPTDYIKKSYTNLKVIRTTGLRSFVGVLLNAFVSYQSILFIDEPEAFLHPPQARLLGKMLAKDLPPERQLFLATHSADPFKRVIRLDFLGRKQLLYGTFLRA